MRYSSSDFGTPRAAASRQTTSNNDPDPRVLPVVLSDVAKIKGLSVADLAEGAQSSGSEAIYASLSNCSPALAASSRVLLSR